MKTRRLGEVATIERRGVDPTTVPDDTVYLGLEHIERGGKILASSTVAESGVTSTKFRFGPDHLLFGKLRPNLAKVSRPTLTGICSTDILPVLPGPHLDRGFLAWYLLQPSMIDFAATRTAGANLPRLSPTVLADFPVPLPPLDEQRRIAAILDAADAIRTKRRQALAHLDTLTQSVFHEMFGDPDGSANEVAFGEIAGLTGGRNLVADDPAILSPFRVLKISSVTSGTFRPSESKPLPINYEPPLNHLVRSGDLLISRANTTELVGTTAIVGAVPDNLVLPDKVWRFDWYDSSSEPRYFHALLSSPAMRRRITRLASGTGGSMKNISKAKLNQMPLPRASSSDQQLFALKAEAISAQRVVAEIALDTADNLFASLQSRAFRGEL